MTNATFGRVLSKVRSLTLDRWTNPLLELLEKAGNVNANEVRRAGRSLGRSAISGRVMLWCIDLENDGRMIAPITLNVGSVDCAEHVLAAKNACRSPRIRFSFFFRLSARFPYTFILLAFFAHFFRPFFSFEWLFLLQVWEAYKGDTTFVKIKPDADRPSREAFIRAKYEHRRFIEPPFVAR